jgi:hypothetical protein
MEGMGLVGVGKAFPRAAGDGILLALSDSMAWMGKGYKLYGKYVIEGQ